MANMTKYTVQTQQLVDNLTKWKNYIDNNTSVIVSFNDTVEALQTQIDDLETRIEALELKAGQNTSYLKLNVTSITIQPQKSIIDNNSKNVTAYVYDKPIRSFVDSDREIYVYSNQTVEGLYLDGKEVLATTDINVYRASLAFHKFTGLAKGVSHHILAINTKAVSNIVLYFSDSSTFAGINDPTASTYKLPIDIKSAITKQIRTTIPSDLIPDNTTITKMADSTVKVVKNAIK